MRRLLVPSFLLLCAALACGAEKRIEFGGLQPGSTPPGFDSTASGSGMAGDWKIVLDEPPSDLPALTFKADRGAKKGVLAQLSTNMADEHFPLLIYNEEVFGDFTLTTHVKAVSGKVEQMAGIAFRLQDEKNYYIVRISALGNTFRFYKFVDGLRSPPIGPEIKIPSGVWHELKIECAGHRIRCFLNGKQVIPDLTDNSFIAGKIGFWTKSDSVSHFSDTHILYKPRIPYAQTLVTDLLQKYPRLIDLKIYALNEEGAGSRLVASRDTSELGKKGGDVEQNVLERGLIYAGKAKDRALATFPLRDHNGETMAAVRVEMHSFLGQTENNVVARALPIIKEMESRVKNARELFE